jgi:hypothetical protein
MNDWFKKSRELVSLIYLFRGRYGWSILRLVTDLRAFHVYLSVIDLFRSRERFFCLFKYGDYEKLSSEYPEVSLHFITNRGVGHRDIVIISNR